MHKPHKWAPLQNEYIIIRDGKWLSLKKRAYGFSIQTVKCCLKISSVAKIRARLAQQPTPTSVL